MPSNNSDTNLFLILQNYLRPFQTWRRPSPKNCKPLSQSECRHNKKSCHLLDKKGTHLMRMYDNNTTCNRSNQNASLPDTYSGSANQHPAAPDTTKTKCYRSAAQCWKAFLVILSVSQSVCLGQMGPCRPCWTCSLRTSLPQLPPSGPIQNCSLGIPPDLLASGRLAFDWKAFLLNYPRPCSSHHPSAIIL